MVFSRKGIPVRDIGTCEGEYSTVLYSVLYRISSCGVLVYSKGFVLTWDGFGWVMSRRKVGFVGLKVILHLDVEELYYVRRIVHHECCTVQDMTCSEDAGRKQLKRENDFKDPYFPIQTLLWKNFSRRDMVLFAAMYLWVLPWTDSRRKVWICCGDEEGRSNL